MFFYRYIPRSTHLHRYETTMQVRFLFGRCVRVPCASKKFEMYRFYERADRDWVYFLVDPELAHTIPPKPSYKPNPCIPGFCSLTKIPRWKSYEVSMLYVNKDHRGTGLSSLMYDAILREGIVLVSGKMQNIGARSLWMKLIKDPRYAVWAQDLMNIKRRASVFLEGDDIECELKLYRDLKMRRRKQTEDIRLVACHDGERGTCRILK